MASASVAGCGNSAKTSSADENHPDPRAFCTAVSNINVIGLDILHTNDVARIKADFAKEAVQVKAARKAAQREFLDEVDAAQRILNNLNAQLQKVSTPAELAATAQVRQDATAELTRTTPKTQRYLVSTCPSILGVTATFS